MHTYVSRVPQGDAMLDAARAAKKLPGTSLDPDGPVAFWGYSQVAVRRRRRPNSPRRTPRS